MEPVKYQRSVPSVQLLNEIEILLAQVRLAELYVKQAQAAAADQVLRIQERYESQLGLLRAGISQKNRPSDESSEHIAATGHLQLQIQSLQPEIGKLRDEIAQKSLDIQRHQSPSRESEQLLQNQVRRLQDELALKQARVSAKESDLERERAEFQAGLRESAALLEETRRQLEERRVGSAKIEGALQERLNESDEQLRRTQLVLEERESELQESRANLAALQSRIAGLEPDIAQAEAFKHETQRTHVALANEIAALRTELDNRDRLLADRQAELAASRQTIAQLETSQRLAEAAANSRLGAARSSYEAELAQLRGTLADREHAFAEREREFQISPARHTAEITGLHAQLAEGQSSLELRTGELQEARSEIAALRERAAQLDLLQQQTERLLAVQAEQIRQRVRAEFEDLDARLASKERELQAVRESAAEALSQQVARSNTLAGQIIAQAEDFNNRLTEQQRLLELQENALARAKEEFDTRLRQKDDAFQALQTQATELQNSLNSELNPLQTQLQDKQRQLENATGEIADLKANVSGLSEQVSQLVTAARDAESRGAAEVERVRLEYQAELLALREELRGQHAALAEREARATELERRLGTHISELETELAARQRSLEEREAALNTASSSATALQDRLALLEASSRDEQIGAAKDFEQVRRVLEAELAGLRNELQYKDRELAQRQAFIDHLAQGHKSEIETLEAKLTELRHGAEKQAAALDQATSERQHLLCRIGQLETAALDAAVASIGAVEHINRRHEAQMAALQIEIERKTAALEERDAARSDMERTHHAELSQLRAESKESHTLLVSRNEELMALKNALESLRERSTQLETTAALTDQARAEERERLRVEYEAQLATLREEVSRADRSDKDQGAMETAQITTGQTFRSRSDRRWRSSGGWKRRWKT